MCFVAAMIAMQVAQTAMAAAQANSEAKAQAKGLARAADRARGEALDRAETDRERAERLRASLRTGYARAGVVSEGSPGDALTSLAADQEQEIQRQLTHSYAEADTLDNQANLVRARARYSLLNSVFSAGQSAGSAMNSGVGSSLMR